jgi:ubiquinone/menaquinone biosynthesis C-methylase UbiE
LVGVDVSSEAIREARQRYGSSARFLVGNMTHLEFSAASFDVVVCLEGIEHIPREAGEIFVGECQRVLRPGGRLLVSSPYAEGQVHSGNPFHLHEYPPEEIHELVRGCFEVEETLTRAVDKMRVLYLCCRRRGHE